MDTLEVLNNGSMKKNILDRKMQKQILIMQISSIIISIVTHLITFMKKC